MAKVEETITKRIMLEFSSEEVSEIIIDYVRQNWRVSKETEILHAWEHMREGSNGSSSVTLVSSRTNDTSFTLTKGETHG